MFYSTLYIMSFFKILLIVWQIIKNQHKIIIFCQIFDTIIYLFVILNCILRIFILQLNFEQTSKQKIFVQKIFQKKFKKNMILIIIFDINCIKWNFQKRCYHVYFFEIVYNNVIENQILIRVKRFENSTKMIYLYYYYIDETWTFFNAIKNIRKCFSKTTTFLNKNIFENVENEINKKINIDEWIWYNEQLFDTQNFHIIDFEFSILFSIELLIKIMKIRIDEFVEISWINFHKISWLMINCCENFFI